MQPMRFGPQTCVILTDAGARLLDTTNGFAGEEAPPADGNGNGDGQRQVPTWDSKTRELRVDNRLVKRFRRPAPMLELVLAAFQELRWPPHMDDL